MTIDGAHAGRVASAILERVREVDGGARVQSITPSDLFDNPNGGVVVRVSPSNASAARLAQLIHRTWRLTMCTTVECAITGETVVQVFVPGSAELLESAFVAAREQSRSVRVLSVLIRTTTIVLVLMLVLSVFGTAVER